MKFRCFGVVFRPDPTRLILTFGANVNARDRVNGNTALHWACMSGNHAVTKQLLDAGTDLSLLNAQVSLQQWINHETDTSIEIRCRIKL